MIKAGGVALHHRQVVAAALGLGRRGDPVGPTPRASCHLATLALTPAQPGPGSAADLEGASSRSPPVDRPAALHPDWPIPDEKLHELAETADGWGAHAVPVTDVTARFRAELLVDRAIALQAADPRFEAEQSDWIDHTSSDGVPLSSATPPVSRRLERPNRFAPRPGLDRTRRHRLVESLRRADRDLHGSRRPALLAPLGPDSQRHVALGHGGGPLDRAAQPGGRGPGDPARPPPRRLRRPGPTAAPGARSAGRRSPAPPCPARLVAHSTTSSSPDA